MAFQWVVSKFSCIHTQSYVLYCKLKIYSYSGVFFSFPSLERFPYKSEFPYRKWISPLGDPRQESTLFTGKGFTTINSSFQKRFWVLKGTVA